MLLSSCRPQPSFRRFSNIAHDESGNNKNFRFFGKSNILLMGQPGAGKTSVARELGKRLNMNVYDIDNDHLEEVWKCAVSEKLSQLGDDKFLIEEANACEMINDKENTIISLTGSVPLNEKGFSFLRKKGLAVFLDVDEAEIVNRCEKMKVDRIVGQKTHSLKDILRYRSSIYNDNYDIRILVEKGADVSRVTDMVLEQINKDQRFVSTRSGLDSSSIIQSSGSDMGTSSRNINDNNFFSVVTQGLAKDRGLFFPVFLPSVSLGQLERLVSLSYPERCLRLLEMWPIASLPPKQLRTILEQAYKDWPSVVPLNLIDRHCYQLELYHGPTASFKDLALQVTPKLFKACAKAVKLSAHSAPRYDNSSKSDVISEDKDDTYLFVVATSGDTGSACLHGFGSTKNTPVIVLYPKGGVSPIQEAQMLSAKGDVCVISVEGDFDYCQTLVKDLFNNTELSSMLWEKYKVKLASGNSINWGRMFPQIPFAFHAYLELVNMNKIKIGDKIDICVPTGNFGNVFGVILAKKMGLPIEQIIVASNSNNILTEFLTTGVFDLRQRKLEKTVSPSIDILLPSNLERFLYVMSDGDHKLVTTLFSELVKNGHFKVPQEMLESMHLSAASCNEPDTLEVIGDVYKRTGHILDPHTAVAHAVGIRFPGNNPMVIAGTAHYLKFPTAVMQALGLPLADSLDAQLAALRQLPTKTVFHRAIDSLTSQTPSRQCPASSEAIQNAIIAFLDRRQV